MKNMKTMTNITLHKELSKINLLGQCLFPNKYCQKCGFLMNTRVKKEGDATYDQNTGKLIDAGLILYYICSKRGFIEKLIGWHESVYFHQALKYSINFKGKIIGKWDQDGWG